MGLFDDELNEITAKSHFDKLKLEALFSAKEKQQLNEVIAILEKESDDNEKIMRLQDMGEKGLKILFKIAKYVLI